MPPDSNPEPVTVPDGSAAPTHGVDLQMILDHPAAAVAAFNQFVEASRARVTELVQLKSQLAAASTEMQAKLAEATNATTQAVAAKTQISDLQAVVATKSDHIQKAQEHADSVRANLDRAFTAATQRLTEIEAKKSTAETMATEAAAFLSDFHKSRSAVESDGAAAEAARKAAEAATVVAKGLAEKAATVDEKIAAYEARLADLERESNEKLKTIIGLLPGATSAGLAHAFDERRQTFLRPHGMWQGVFVVSVILIVALTATGLWHVIRSASAPTYDELIRLWLSRLPVAGALVWLAMYASREAALAKRLEEDYGYKSAIASCFEGFQRQMSEVQHAASANSPLSTLCDNTLKTIATPPGRIYERHALTVSPTDEVREATRAVIRSPSSGTGAAK